LHKLPASVDLVLVEEIDDKRRQNINDNDASIRIQKIPVNISHNCRKIKGKGKKSEKRRSLKPRKEEKLGKGDWVL
jgi:hypothetical protein